MTPKLTAIIKKIAMEAIEASKPAAVVYGEVTSTTPLTIRLNQLLELSGTTLIETTTVSGKLAVGDLVIMLRQQGGQKFIILDKYEVKK